MALPAAGRVDGAVFRADVRSPATRRAGPRGGHGYYCNDHFAFHYFTGYDPYGWRRASYRGYYPPRGCYLVERVEYRRGRRVLVGGYSCLDPYGYAYIQLGSQFVLRYY